MPSAAIRFEDLRPLRILYPSLARGARYRFRMFNDRAGVERFDIHELQWILVSIDDSAERAFGDMMRVVYGSYGVAVCSGCGVILPKPELCGNRVVCAGCFVRPSRSFVEWLASFNPWEYLGSLMAACLLAWLLLSLVGAR